ncbi:MAG: MBL fold metallo-hydrolase, partial [Clostridia bacterium]
MHCEKQIINDIYWVGGNDRRLSLFENAFPISKGISYNSYLVLDEKTILLDGVDKSIERLFFENIDFLLKDRTLDYLVVNHMEPDHCFAVLALAEKFCNMKIIGNAKTKTMLKQFFDFDIEQRFVTVSEGDKFSSGRHTFSFVMAPMVHWPETMVTFDETDKVLFSADAFGTFGALNGNIFADELDFESAWLFDARRYYTNIVGKYGVQVQSLLKKSESLDIKMICPLHGPIWRKNIAWFIEKYKKWSSYSAEENSVLIVYSSVYGNTENAVEILASQLASRGIQSIAMYDAAKTHVSDIVAECFRCKYIVFAAPTYNMGIFASVETVLL